MIQCLVIDDEPYARELLTEFIRKVPMLQLVGSFSSPLVALPALKNSPIQVIFLDIQMPDLNGIDFLRTLDHRPGVVLTTAFSEYAVEGFELDVIDYLLKPFDFPRFLKCVHKITHRLEQPIVTPSTIDNTDEEILFVKDGTKLVKIVTREVLFIQGTREYVTIHTKNKKVMSLLTLKGLESGLPSYFVRVHNSYIVNLHAISAIGKDEIEVDSTSIPIGITYKKQFIEKIKSIFPGKAGAII